MSESDGQEGSQPAQGDEVEQTRAFLSGVLERMGLTLEVDAHLDGKIVRVSLAGEGAGDLVSGRGAAARSTLLEALQTVAGRAMDAGESRTVVIDAGDFREQRIALLAPGAERLARLAVERSMPVKVYGMNSFDRRAVHVALAKRDDVRTDSEGEGVFRTLVIVPASGDSSPSDE